MAKLTEAKDSIGDAGFEQTFQHCPLQHPADQIRLLQFSQQKDNADELELMLTAWSLKHAPRFKAVSYTWGPLETKRLFVNCRPLLVRSNCYYTLQQVRARCSTDYIWLDSICINQDDNEEKRHQVAMMNDIYDKASLVLVCIGQHENDSEMVAETAARMEKAVRAVDEDVDQLDTIVIGPLYRKHWTRCIDSLDKAYALSLGQALIDFVQRPYWQRLWIVQEIVAARRDLLVLCGDSSISWLGIYLLLELTSVHHAKSIPSILQEDPAYLDYCDAVHVANLWDDPGLESRDLAVALRTGADKLCSDPRDRIYGLLGLIEWPEGVEPIRPDYTVSPLQLTIQAIENISELESVDKVLVALGVTSADAEMQQLVRDIAREPRDSKTSKFLKDCWFSGIRLAAANDRMPPFRLVSSLEGLNVQQVPENMKKPLHETLSPGSPNAPKYLSKGHDLAGLICHDTEHGDILAFPDRVSNSSSRQILVLRSGPNGYFDVVGQGFVFRPHEWPIVPIWRPSSGWIQGYQTKERDPKEFLSLHINMTAEDAVRFIGQDLVVGSDDDDEGFDPEARFERLFVNPIRSQKAAAYIRQPKEVV